jgi:hypothetical protein
VPPYKHREQHSLHTIRYGPRHWYRHHILKVGHKHRARLYTKSLRRKRLKLIGGFAATVVLLAVVLLGLTALRAVLSAKHSVDAAQAVINEDLANKSLMQSSDGRAALAGEIQTVANSVATAEHTLKTSFGLRVLGDLPFLNTQRNGLLTLVNDVGVTANTATELLQRLDTVVNDSSGTTVSLPALHALEQSVVQARTTMAPLDRPSGDLWGSLGTARRTLNDKVVEMNTLLARADKTLSYALPFLGADGPRTYLIAGENNAEMRDQGAVLSLALLHADNGTLSVDTTGSVDNLEPTQPVDVPIPAGTQTVFGGFEPTLLWQSVNATADFPFSAQVMQAMYAQVAGQHVDGVIAVDVPTLESLLIRTGPVVVPGITGLITAQNVGETLLHQQYTQYSGGSQTERHDNISATAKAIVDQMKLEHIDLAALGSILASDISGRHLMIWDEVPSYESALNGIDATGSLTSSDPGRTVHIAVENATATKLDYYVTLGVNFQVYVASDGDALVNAAVVVKNNTPAGLGPTYQTGPDNINSHTPGQYITRTFLWAPQGAFSPGSVVESGLPLTQAQVSVLPQQEQTMTFAFIIHHAVRNGQLTLRLIPPSRLTPATLHIDVTAPGWHLGGPAHATAIWSTTLVPHWTLTH